MATWTISQDLHVTWRATGKPMFDCGTPDAGATFEDVLSWAALQAGPFDVLNTPKGPLVRQARADA
jgi:hypothetical protein